MAGAAEIGGKAVEWRLAAPLGLTYVLFFAAPLLILLVMSFSVDDNLTGFTIASWVKFWGDPFYRGVVWDTLRLGLLAVAATSLLAYPLAMLYVASGPRARQILLFIILLPLLTSVVIRTFAWIAILAREGVINQTILALGLATTPLNLLQTELGLVIALTQIEMPLMLLPLITVMNQINPSLADASRALGGSKWRTFRKITLPLSLPGWIAGATLVFASSTTAFISQQVIGGARLVYLPSLIWQQAMVVYDWPFAAVASVTLLLAVLSGVSLFALLGRFARTG
jgi:putative spermidine/putrescine transport system permease protein